MLTLDISLRYGKSNIPLESWTLKPIIETFLHITKFRLVFMNYFLLITKIAFLTAMNARTGVHTKPSKSRPPRRRVTGGCWRVCVVKCLVLQTNELVEIRTIHNGKWTRLLRILSLMLLISRCKCSYICRLGLAWV